MDWIKREGEMGIIVHSHYQRCGIGLEVHLSCLANAFEVFGLHTVIFMTSHKNGPMQDFYHRFGIKF